MSQQPALLLGTPKIVVAALKKLERSQQGVAKAIITTSNLEAKLTTAKTVLAARENQNAEIEKATVIACCFALERELMKNGKGWCPICKRVVNFIGFGCAVTEIPRHRSEHYGDHGYGGGTPARDWIEYVYWRVPDVTSHKGCERMYERVRGYPLEHSFGGTIADAPAELFTQYGIPAFDEEILKRSQLKVWDFQPEASYKKSA